MIKHWPNLKQRGRIDSMIDYRTKLDGARAAYALAADSVAQEKRGIAAAETAVMEAGEARRILQVSAQAVQQQAHARIAGVVSRCLETVFAEDAYQFKMDFVQKRGRTEARLLLVRDGLEISPLDAAGGGVVDVASFALRLACLVLSRPPVRRLIVADEPMKHLSKNYRPQVRALLAELAAELEIQFIIVTHDPALMMGKVVEL